MISGPNGEVIALIVAAVVFGLFHCINLSYVIITTVIGMILGVFDDPIRHLFGPGFGSCFV